MIRKKKEKKCKKEEKIKPKHNCNKYIYVYISDRKIYTDTYIIFTSKLKIQMKKEDMPGKKIQKK